MSPNRMAFAVVAAACVVAAGVGAYVATRQNPPAQAAPAVQPALLRSVAIPEGRPVPQAPGAEATESAASATTPAPKPTTEARRPASASRTPVAPAAARPAPQAEDKPAADPGQVPAPSVPAAAPIPVDNPPVLAQVQALTPPELPEPPPPTFKELVVPAESVIGLQNDTTLSSEYARVEDRVEAHVTRDVRVHGEVAIPSGSRAIGTVTEVDRGGRFRDRAHLSVRFDTIILADGTRLPISTDPVVRDGDSPNGTAKVGGGAVAGAILGAIIGGAKGAAVGATAGAGAGTAAAAVGGRSDATLSAGTPITVRILAPITVTIEKE